MESSTHNVRMHSKRYSALQIFSVSQNTGRSQSLLLHSLHIRVILRLLLVFCNFILINSIPIRIVLHRRRQLDICSTPHHIQYNLRIKELKHKPYTRGKIFSSIFDKYRTRGPWVRRCASA